MNDEDNGAPLQGALDLTIEDLLAIWTVLYLMPNAMNQAAREKIEEFLTLNGIPVTEMRANAEQARRFVESIFGQENPPAA